LRPKSEKVLESKKLAKLNWTIVDSDGSLFSRGKHDYYAILVRGIPEEHPEDCIVELYVTDKELTIVEIENCAYREQIKLLSRSIVLDNLLPVTSICQVVEEMKVTAESRENENPYRSISSDYRSK
jgi:hypothetical protein